MAILFGCLTAILFAGSSLMSSRIVHRINQNSAIAWIMFLGTLWSIPFLIHSGVPQGLSIKDVAILAWAGIGNVLGLIISFQALRVGKVGLVAPIVSTEGALAAVMSSLFGFKTVINLGSPCGGTNSWGIRRSDDNRPCTICKEKGNRSILRVEKVC